MRAPWLPWEQHELTALVRLNAEGKTNPEMYPHFPNRSPRAVDAKLKALGLERNLTPNGIMAKTNTPQRDKFDKWHVKVEFEDVTPWEARRISADAPTSAPYSRPVRNPIGTPWADMVR